MARSVPEWIGKTDDAMPSKAVRLRIFDAHGGRCHVTGRKIGAGDKWALDHITALCNGGENRESNLAPILEEAHKAKTAEDVAIKAKTNRIRAKHLGLHKPKTPLPGGRGSKWKKTFAHGWVLREQE